MALHYCADALCLIQQLISHDKTFPGNDQYLAQNHNTVLKPETT